LNGEQYGIFNARNPIGEGGLKARGCGGQVAGCEAVRLRAGRCKFFVIFFDGILKIPLSLCWWEEGDLSILFIEIIGLLLFPQMWHYKCF
jgi:hypothetical protein